MRSLPLTIAVILIWLIALSAVSGCAGVDSAKSEIAQHGAAISDEARDTALWTICKAISVGSWMRAFGSDVKKAEAWRVLCSDVVSQTP